MKLLPFLVAMLFLGLACVASALAGGGLYSVRSAITLTDKRTGEDFTVPADQGYSYSIVDIKGSETQLRIFDREGKEVQGNFLISAQALQELRARELGAGLKAAVAGPQGSVPACCDVEKDPESAPPPVAVKKPSPALKASVVEGPKEVVRQSEPPRRKESEGIYERRLVDVNGSSSLGATRRLAISPPVYSTDPWEGAPPARPRLTQSRYQSADRDHSGRASWTWGWDRHRDESIAPRRDNVATEEFSPPDAPVVNIRRTPKEERERRLSTIYDSSRYCEAYKKFRGKVPDVPLRQLLYYLSQDPEGNMPGRSVKGTNIVEFADYSQPSENERYYQLDIDSGEVTKAKVSHGSGTCGAYGCSGGTRSMLTKCGTSSHYTRSGFYKIESTYYSTHGRSSGWPMLSGGSNGLRMRGLTPYVNWGSEGDGIVMHEAPYNTRQIGAPMGRSNGCVAFAPGCLRPLLNDISGGSLFYSYAPQCGDQMRKVEQQIRGWENFCR
jgi:L,D-transpeptidase catalytic domain